MSSWFIKRFFILLSAMFLFTLSSRSQVTDTIVDDYYNANYLRYENYTYKNNIKTILFHKEGWELTPPLIALNSGDKLKLSFDDLNGGVQTYKYTVVHCDAFWKPSDLIQSEYIDGFIDDNISAYKYSFNTIQPFTHYDVTFPNENIRINKSGNYLLKVFIDDNPDDIIFTRRFMIYENLVNVTSTIKPATIIEDKYYKQEIDFVINSGNYSISNAYSDLKVVITQNDRWDNAISNLKPKYIRSNELVYDYEDGNVFNGGSEFRKFDMKSLKYQTAWVRKSFRDSIGNQVYLMTDQKRNINVYSSDQDINGRRLVKTEDYDNTDIEADYAWVHFTLPYSEPLIDGSLYVFGALSDWGFGKENIMIYNYKKSFYEANILLKQGYYNYDYVFVKNGENVGDETFIEGSHYETENDYTIYVYHKQPGTLFDKLIGVKALNSVRQK